MYNTVDEVGAVVAGDDGTTIVIEGGMFEGNRASDVSSLHHLDWRRQRHYFRIKSVPRN